ncbi:hypothetical protein Syun_002800 [Stephania yunnanensis]|uniref:F-box domain-containing protein n=1 Tax=Stephania yunnanensis TaxID=152371 RepID=A0AAP0LH22_9MAGN
MAFEWSDDNNADSSSVVHSPAVKEEEEEEEEEGNLEFSQLLLWKASSSSSINSSVTNITDLPPALVSEILCRLDPKELGVISCVSTLLHRLASEHQGWKNFYCERWGLPLAPKSISSPGGKSWKDIFIERESRSRTFLGRYSIDILYGHTEAVRSVFVLSSSNLIFTAGYDSVIRMWDMEEGFSIASSQPLGCTIRALAADSKLLVAGGTGSFIQCWKAVEDLPHLFHLAASHTTNNSEFLQLWEHQGPVTCLALDPFRIYSGSWDMTVRVWDRSLFKCSMVLRHNDWVWSLVPRASTLASSAGGNVYFWDVDTGDLVSVLGNAHVGNACSLARSHMGDLLFTGGDDGSIRMFECTKNCNFSLVASWNPHSDSVNSLAFEFPWLVSASSDGKMSLIDIRKLLKSSRSPAKVNQVAVTRTIVEPPQRMLHGFGWSLFSVGVGGDRIVCGGEEGVVRVWNFSQALEIEQRVQALREMRLDNRMQRRKLQMEMNLKGSQGHQCSVAAKNQMNINGNRNGSWHGRRGVGGKLKA